MSDTYYSYREVKVKIAHRLQHMDGWTVYGYHADNSDPMSDYYDPAYWDGIAEKNGFRLVVDKSSEREDRTETRTRYGVKGMSAETREKISKLEQMTQERGASAAEEATAKAKIKILQEKEAAQDETYTVFYPGHKANPPRCNWHIEKDGIIIDKGTGLLKFARVADITLESEVKEWQKFNTKTPEEWKAAFIDHQVCYWGEHERERATESADRRYKEAAEYYALLDAFNNLIARFNNICGGMVGNSGEGGYTYAKRTETKYKKVYQFQATESGSFTAGQCFKVLGRFTYGCGGNVYRLTESSREGALVAYRVSLKSNKILTGSATVSNCFGYYAADTTEGNIGRDKEKFLNWIAKGAITWGEVVEVLEPYEVEKFVKVDADGREVKTRAAKAATAEATQETTTESTTAPEYIITADTDTRDNSPLWVVKFSERVSRETYEAEREKMKSLGGYYSKFKKGFIFREDPTAKLYPEQGEEAPAEGAQDAETAAAEEVPTAAAETATEGKQEFTQGNKLGSLHTVRTINGQNYIIDAADLRKDCGFFEVAILDADGETVKEYRTTTAAEARRVYWTFCEMWTPEEKPTESTAEAPTSAAETTAEETPTDTPEEPQNGTQCPEYGYTGETSAQFDERELDLLYKGAQIIKGEDYYKHAYFTTAYIDGVRLVYALTVYREDSTPAPGHDAKYRGFITGGKYYESTTAAATKLAEDINAALLQMIPTEADAEKNAGTLETWEAERVQTLKEADYTNNAERLFVDGNAPELSLYSSNGYNIEAIIRYILNPAEVVTEYATEAAKSKGAEIYYQYIEYNRTRAALDEIKADISHRAHTLKRIAEATAGDEAKSYKLTLANGATVKADADAVRRVAYWGYINAWNIATADRDKLNKDERGRAQDITAADIKQITHGARLVYNAA